MCFFFLILPFFWGRSGDVMWPKVRYQNFLGSWIVKVDQTNSNFDQNMFLGGRMLEMPAVPKEMQQLIRGCWTLDYKAWEL